MQNVIFLSSNKFIIKAVSNKLVNENIFVSGFTSINEADEFLDEYSSELDIVLLQEDPENPEKIYITAKSIRNVWNLDIPIILLTENYNINKINKASDYEINLLFNNEIINNHKRLISFMNLLHKLYINKKENSVLIIDDSKISREKLKFELKGGYYEVHEAKNGVIGIELAKKYKPDFIILDIEMPGFDGFETTKSLKENAETSHIPVIFYANKPSAKMKLKASEAGVVDFFNKQNRPGEMLKYIDELYFYEKGRKFKKCIYYGFSEIKYQMIRHVLKKIDIEVQRKDSLDTAKNFMENYDVDGILLDIVNDNLKSYDELMDMVNNIERTYVPIIAIVGKGKTDLHLKLLKKGITDYITEPFFEEELTLRVALNFKYKEALRRLKSKDEMLSLLSIIDSETGAYNRNYLEDILDSFISRFDREGINFSLITVIVDKYDYIVENFGKSKASEVLKKITNKMIKFSRPTDMIFRYNNYKFLILLEGAAYDEVDIVTNRIINNMGDLVMRNEKELYHKVNLKYDYITYENQSKAELLEEIENQFK
ncbi:MAG: response regulator [Candidatus Mcinerneyibacterium aminivorans]|uniref:Response regulator n=1 Tax=Candidatus Mcinerneyibacterium aminivorans TaxID=2703815 RepID=A0A5D0MI60_9BACT|nr:MAG: response regulator [Candidatus Mcinerneyibacterium aminivorans]